MDTRQPPMPQIPEKQLDPRQAEKEQAIIDLLRRAGVAAEGLVPENEPPPDMDPRPRPNNWQIGLTGAGDALNTLSQAVQQRSDSGSYYGYKPLEQPQGTKRLQQQWMPEQAQWDRANQRRQMAGWGADLSRDNDVQGMQGQLAGAFQGPPPGMAGKAEEIQAVAAMVFPNDPEMQNQLFFAMMAGRMLPSKAAPPSPPAPSSTSERADLIRSLGLTPEEEQAALLRLGSGASPGDPEPQSWGEAHAKALIEGYELAQRQVEAGIGTPQAVTDLAENYATGIANAMFPGGPGPPPGSGPPPWQYPEGGMSVPGAQPSEGPPMSQQQQQQGQMQAPQFDPSTMVPQMDQVMGDQSLALPQSPPPAEFLPSQASNQGYALPSIPGGQGSPFTGPGVDADTPDGRLRNAVSNYFEYIQSLPPDDPRLQEKIEDVKRAFENEYGVDPDDAYDRIWS